MILLDSLYINNSGGKVLLDYLVQELEKTDLDVFYLFDTRCKNDYKFIPPERKIYLKASIFNRYQFYKQKKKRFSKVFCFGNIPPPIKLACPIYTYFHNVSLLEQPKTYFLKEKLLKKLKLKFIKYYSDQNNVFIVQSRSVKTLVRKHFKNNKIHILPFFKQLKSSFTQDIKENKKEDAFVYISNGNTHKNHFSLFKAWEILANNNFYPVLHITITSKFTNHIQEVQRLQLKGLKIINHGFCNPVNLYARSQFLIYPSIAESFGLGLVEGIKFECEVIASDLDFVLEVCEPYLVFNPYNVNSIVASVEKALLDETEVYKTKPIIKNKIKELIEVLAP